MDVIDVGLAQMDDAGLRRVIAHIDAGKPVNLDGKIVTRSGEG